MAYITLKILMTGSVAFPATFLFLGTIEISIISSVPPLIVEMFQSQSDAILIPLLMYTDQTPDTDLCLRDITEYNYQEVHVRKST